MITIPLSTADITKVRLAPSPFGRRSGASGCSCTRGATRFTLPGRPTRCGSSPARTSRRSWPRCAWRAAARVSLPSPPEDSAATVGEELERLRATPVGVVHDDVEAFVRGEEEQFGTLAPEKERMLETYLKDPEGSLRRLVDELGRYHDLAISPHWPRVREYLKGDTLRRGQALALGGVEALLSGLHPRASYKGGVLELDRTYEATIDPAGRGITLVPCVFTWTHVC